MIAKQSDQFRADGAKAAQGFTLIEIAMVLVVMGLILSMGLSAGQNYLIKERLRSTQAKLDAVEEALVQYVSANGFLPCPAVGTGTATGVASYDSASATTLVTCSNNQQNGIVPWATLGLSADTVIDSWGRYFTYRVFDGASGFTRNATATPVPPAGTLGGLDMHLCHPAGSAATAGGAYCADATTPTSPANFLTGKGLLVCINDACTEDSTPPVGVINNPTLTTGAAYVLISHGEDGDGALTRSGAQRPGSTEQEDQNYNGTNVHLTVNVPYVDSRTLVGFDDFVRHPSALAVATKAGLGPRDQ